MTGKEWAERAVKCDENGKVLFYDAMGTLVDHPTLTNIRAALATHHDAAVADGTLEMKVSELETDLKTERERLLDEKMNYHRLAQNAAQMGRDAQNGISQLRIELAEAQQWIDSEPGWKDKYMENLKAVKTERDGLAAKLEAAESGKQELIRHNGVIMEQLKAEQKNRDETVAKLAESEKARGIMQTARDNLEQWQKRAEEYALNNGNLRRSCQAKERELVHLRQASGNLTAENTKLRASKAELTKLLNEAGGLLCEHHAYGIMDGIRLGGECPACSKKGTEKYPNNIFGRIDAATKGAATPGVRMWQAAHVNAWDGSMMWFLRDNGEWMDSSHTLASIIDQDNRELSPAEVAAVLAAHPLPDHVPDEVRAYSPGDDAKAAAEPPKVRRWKRVDGEFTGGVVYVQCTDGKTCYSVWENGRKVPDSTFDISHTEAYVRDGLWRELTDAENAAIDAPKAAPPADEIPFGKPARTTAEIERDADTLSQHIYVAMRPPTMAERLRLRDFEDEYRAAQAREAKS